MEEEKTTIEILCEFAEKTNREVKYTEVPYPSNSSRYGVRYLSKLYIPNNSHEKTYFVCFSDQKKFGELANFSGVFFPLSVSKSSKIRIRKKNILDRLNPFFKPTSKYKSGNRRFDSNIVISENDLLTTKRILNNKESHDLIKKVFKFDERLRIAINEVNVDFVPELKGKSHFGILMFGQWLTDEKKIEKLFKYIEDLKTYM